MQDGLAANALELWRGDRCLIDGLSFSAPAGKIIRIAGHNGSGKTTLLRALCGLSLIESGQVSWQGRDIFHDPDQYHADLSWLGHRDGLKPELTVQENLATFNGIAGRSAQNIPQMLAASEILHLSALPVRSLSAGQKRRVALTRVFHSSAPLWILDEPFANLDQQGQSWGIDMLRQHAADGGICIISTHLPLDDDGIVTVRLSS